MFIPLKFDQNMTKTGFDLHLYIYIYIVYIYIVLDGFWVLDHRMAPVRRATGFVRPSSSAQPRGAGERRESQRHQGAPRHDQRFSYETPWPLGLKTGWEAKLRWSLEWYHIISIIHWDVSIASFHWRIPSKIK